MSSFVQVTTVWMMDLRQGYCVSDFRLRQSHCCPSGRGFRLFTLLDARDCDQWVSWSTLFSSLSSPSILSPLIYIISGTLLALLSSLIVTLSPHSPPSSGPVQYYAAGSGIPQVKTLLGGFIIRGCLGFSTLVVKMLALIPAIASGLVLGEQGPMVHVSCAIGNVVSRLFPKYHRNEGKRREILSAACAAGVSVAFGAPIGGVLFSLEEVSYYFPLKTLWRSFYCALVAAVTLRLLDPFGTGRLVKFQVTSESRWNPVELVPFALLGSLGGLYGALFIRLARKMSLLTKQSSALGYKIGRVVLVAIVTALLSYFSSQTQKNTVDLIADLYTVCPSGQTCNLLDWERAQGFLWALAVKIVCMILAFGIHVPGGIFVPSMAVGALSGHLMASLVALVQPYVF